MATVNDLIYVEHVGKSGESPSVASFGTEGARVSQVLDVGIHDSPREIPELLLGWSEWDRAKRDIIRHVPVSHGAFPWLYCTSLTSVHGFGKWTDKVPLQPNSQTHFAQFEKYRVNAVFSSLPYNVLSQAIPGRLSIPGQPRIPPYHVYTTWTYEPGIEVIERVVSANQWKFANGPSTGTAFPRGIQAKAYKSHLTVKWHQIPTPAVLGPNGILSPYLLNGLGKINHDVWPPTANPADPSPTGMTAPDVTVWGGTAAVPPGYPKNELLLTQIGLEKVELPVLPTRIGYTPLCNTPVACNVVFKFQHFAPPLDPDFKDYRGHVLCPSITADANAKYFYLVTAGGALTGARIYQEYDYDLLFEVLG